MDEQALAGSRRPPASPAGRLRAWGDVLLRWDLLGVAALISLALLATAVGLADGGRSTSYLVVAFGVAGIALAGTGLLAGAAAARDGVPLSRVPSALAAVWARPAGDQVVVLFACVLALPVVSFYSPVLGADSDSARLLASVLHVQRDGPGYLVDFQEVFLPHLLLGPLVKAGGIPAVQAYNVFSVIALAGVAAFIVRRLTGSMFAVLVTVLALTSFEAVLERTFRLPMYSTMLALGFLGVYVAHRAVTTDDRGPRLRYSLLAALLLVLSAEAHQVGQLFLVFTALLVLGTRPGRTALRLVPLYAAVAVLALPRLIVNLWEGGLDYVLANRVDYWITKEYLVPIQTQFFNQPRLRPLDEYVGLLPEGLYKVWGLAGLFALALGAACFVLARRRLRVLALAFTVFMILVTVQLRLPFFPRYFSLLVVGSALAAGVAGAALLDRFPGRRTLVGGGIVACLLVANALSYHSMINSFARQKADATSDAYSVLAAEIGNGEGVVGTRSYYLNRTTTDFRTYGDQFLTEEEYVTFLTWPSDEEAIEVLRGRDAQWVLVPFWKERYVHRYNDVWLRPAYGERTRYPRAVSRSPWFCLARVSGDAELYRLRAAPAGPDDPRRCRR